MKQLASLLTLLVAALTITDPRMTLSTFQRKYGITDLQHVSTVHRGGGPNDKQGSDVYYSKSLNAEISVSLTGEIQDVLIKQ